MFLSQTTTRRPSKPKSSSKVEWQCPHCLKVFQRLDLHLRRSATCSPQAQASKMKLANPSPQQQHSTSRQASNTQSMRNTSTIQLSDLSHFTPSSLTTNKPIQSAKIKEGNWGKTSKRQSEQMPFKPKQVIADIAKQCVRLDSKL